MGCGYRRRSLHCLVSELSFRSFCDNSYRLRFTCFLFDLKQILSSFSNSKLQTGSYVIFLNCNLRNIAQQDPPPPKIAFHNYTIRKQSWNETSLAVVCTGSENSVFTLNQTALSSPLTPRLVSIADTLYNVYTRNSCTRSSAPSPSDSVFLASKSL
jgi:hypothetical protein